MDAAKEGTNTPGIAGWCHGWTWAWFYPESWLQLPIAVHEFLAFAVSVIQFSPMLAEAPQVVFETDSISAAFILEKDNAKSPLMQIAFHLLQQTQEWVALIVDAGERERTARHVKGKINIFADAESRGYHNLISDLCMQLGIKRRGMELTDAAQAYLAAFAKDASPLVPLPLQGLDVSPACNLHDGPPTITKKWKTPRARDRPRCRCPYGDCHCHRVLNSKRPIIAKQLFVLIRRFQIIQSILQYTWSRSNTSARSTTGARIASGLAQFRNN